MRTYNIMMSIALFIAALAVVGAIVYVWRSKQPAKSGSTSKAWIKLGWKGEKPVVLSQGSTGTNAGVVLQHVQDTQEASNTAVTAAQIALTRAQQEAQEAAQKVARAEAKAKARAEACAKAKAEAEAKAKAAAEAAKKAEADAAESVKKAEAAARAKAEAEVAEAVKKAKEEAEAKSKSAVEAAKKARLESDEAVKKADDEERICERALEIVRRNLTSAEATMKTAEEELKKVTSAATPSTDDLSVLSIEAEAATTEE